MDVSSPALYTHISILQSDGPQIVEDDSVGNAVTSCCDTPADVALKHTAGIPDTTHLEGMEAAVAPARGPKSPFASETLPTETRLIHMPEVAL